MEKRYLRVREIFQFLGSIIHRNGEVGKDDVHRAEGDG